jgi:hypothetical protein
LPEKLWYEEEDKGGTIEKGDRAKNHSVGGELGEGRSTGEYLLATMNSDQKPTI